MTRIKHPTELVWSLGCGVLGAVAVLLAGGLTWLAGGLAVGLLAAGGLLGYKLINLRQGMQTAIEDYLANIAQP